uniref:Uncharacterized protein n=1 Tax=Seriola dumerili TaxID=41447 RepID=A0A3B4U2T6_SERDU
MHSKAKVHDGGGGDHNHLKDPEANVRQRRECVVAHVFTTRLLCVTHKFTLFIHDAKDDEEGEPDFAYEGGVIGNLIQQTCEEAPAHFATGTGGNLSNLSKERDKTVFRGCF